MKVQDTHNAGSSPWLYPRARPHWLLRVSAWITALGLTACTALLIPFSDMLTSAPQRSVDYRTVDIAAWQPPPPEPPPPPPPEPEPPPEKPPEETAPETPRLERPQAQPKPRLKLPVQIDFALTAVQSDLVLDFEVDPDVEVLPEETPPPPPPAPPPPPEPEPQPAPLDKQPQVVSQIKPIYPYRARTRRIEGYVDLQFTVTEGGRAEGITVLDGQPEGVFESPAVRAVQRWRFSPAVRDGSPVAVRMQIRIRFTLDD